MNVQDISKRYGLPPKEVRDFLKKNFVEINAEGEYVKNVKRDWIVDDAGITIIDKMLGFTPTVQTPPVPVNVLADNDGTSVQGEQVASPETEKKIQTLESEKKQLQDEISRVVAAYQKIQGEYTSLQNSFIALQEGKESMNASMIRKYRELSEKQKAQLIMAEKRCKTLEESKTKQYNELQSRIDELQAEVSEKTELMKQKLASEHKSLEAKKLCDKLREQLAESERKVDSLTEKLQQSELDYDAISVKLAEYKHQFSIIGKTLATAQAQVDAVTTAEELDLEHEVEVSVTNMESTDSTETTETITADTEEAIAKETATMEETVAEEVKETVPEPIEEDVPVQVQAKELSSEKTTEATPSENIEQPATSEKLVVKHLGRNSAPIGKDTLVKSQLTKLKELNEENLANAEAEANNDSSYFGTLRQRIASFIGFM